MIGQTNRDYNFIYLDDLLYSKGRVRPSKRDILRVSEVVAKVSSLVYLA